MAEPVRARRLTDQEGRRLLQIVASASGTLVPAIARAGPEPAQGII